MHQATTEQLSHPASSARDVLTEILRDGATRMLAQAIEAEADDWIASHAHVTDENDHRQIVRNGHLPARKIQTGVGAIEVKQPRVRDRRPVEDREPFNSSILPRYLRKTKSVQELIPWLYLKGVSTGGFTEALQALFGPDAPGLSATTITRLKAGWETEYQQWSHRSLENKRYVYVWADGVYFNVRLESQGNQRQCILVLMGATTDGKKELLAIIDGYRESEQSWREVLLDVRRRGLVIDPALAIADGALGFWAAARKIWPGTREQRCWVHKTANILNKMPKSIQPKAKDMLHEIWMAETKLLADQAFDAFVETFKAKYPAAVECLVKDRDVLLTFYDFQAEHWKHIRTTNPIESMFATVRLRHRRTKGNGSRVACLAMVFKLAESAQRRWRVLNGYQLIPDVISGVPFVDGIKKVAA